MPAVEGGGFAATIGNYQEQILWLIMKNFVVKIRWAKMCVLATFAAASTGLGGTSESKPRYETDYAHTVRLASDLHQALDAKQRRSFQSVPVLLTESRIPSLQPCERSTGPNKFYGVSISSGFIEFANALTHAMALDEVRRGYFKGFLNSLAEGDGSGALALLDLTHAQSWSFDVMNHQMSRFNQIMGTLVAIDMAHHYLGHYSKYAAQLAQNGQPINNLVTPAEWRKAVLRGSHNALQCALGIDGLKELFDTIDKLPARPAWAIQVAAPRADLAKIRKELDKLEEYFFAGRQYLD